MGSSPRELLEEAATGHPGATVRAVADGRTWSAGAQPFAVLTASTVEFRLRPDMVRAALRTPGVAVSSRGEEWVAFTPSADLDRYDIDRLSSWFEMAARLAGV